MQIKYIGKCVKTDSVLGVGLNWTPGQVRNVTPEVAERLLRFSDTWQVIQGEDTGKEPPIGLMVADKPVEEPLPVIDFHAMDKASLVQFAEREYNVRLDKRLSDSSLRHKVIALFGQHQSEFA
ncbi:MAG TPA: hypothetical protein VIU43_08485 [Nitrosospira sp.]